MPSKKERKPHVAEMQSMMIPQTLYTRFSSLHFRRMILTRVKRKSEISARCQENGS
jgi:hypothetical protein